KAGLKLGALGGPQTFNGQAAQLLRETYPEFREIVYFPTSAEVVDAAIRGDVDAACAPEQMSRNGFHPGMLARMAPPTSILYVVAEVARAYDCALLGKPETRLAKIRLVLGHDGSINHSRSWLEANLENAEIKIVDTNSRDAARSALNSDGSIACVGS